MAQLPTDVIFETDGDPEVAVLLNKNSGERAAADFVREQLEEIFTADRIFDLFPVKGEGPKIDAAKEFILKHRPHILIVAGGDGTISLGLDITDSLRQEGQLGSVECPVAILPMGTGNDLSRSLGFGGGYAVATINAKEKFAALIQKTINAVPCYVDRFKVDVYKNAANNPNPMYPAAAGEGEEEKPVYSHNFINYFSVGFDAEVAQNFGDFRDKNPEKCNSRTKNKMWYGYFGCGAMVKSSSFPKDRVSLKVDGETVKVRSGVKSLIMLNVITFSGGVKMWSDPKQKFAPQLLDDKKLEIMSMDGVWHMVGATTKSRRPNKVAQGGTIELRVPADRTMQYDGEPLPACGTKDEDVVIKISHVSQSLVSKLPEGVVNINYSAVPLHSEENGELA